MFNKTVLAVAASVTMAITPGAVALAKTEQPTQQPAPTATETLPAEDERHVPKRPYDGIQGEGRFVSIDGDCGIAFAGDNRCWDLGWDPNNTAPATTKSSTIKDIPGRVTTMAGSATAGCALTAAGKVFCWGLNEHGEVTPGNPTEEPEAPQEIAGLPHDLRHITYGPSGACASGRDVYCWGSAAIFGEDWRSSATPRKVNLPDNSGTTSLSGWGDQACASFRSGDAYCWGHHQAVKMTDENRPDTARGRIKIDPKVPVKLHELVGHVVDVQINGEAGCILNLAGQMKCWGINRGDLADENQKGGYYTYPPKLVTEYTEPLRKMSLGSKSTCGITWHNKARCLGQHFSMGDDLGEYMLMRGWERGVKDTSSTLGVNCKFNFRGRVVCHANYISATGGGRTD